MNKLILTIRLGLVAALLAGTGQAQTAPRPTPTPAQNSTTIEALVKRGDAGCCAYLPNLDTYAEYQDIYAPTGPLNLAVKFDRRDDVPALTARLRPDGMAGRFDAFPYPVREVRGNR